MVVFIILSTFDRFAQSENTELFLLAVSALSLPFGLEGTCYRFFNFHASAITSNESKTTSILNI